MFNNTISVCLIVKNEEKNIGRCLKSVKNIADEIIVVDTGSSDKTVSIAKSFGAKIFFKKWKNDFSMARNESLKHATKNWILFLDADEELPEEEGLKLKNLLKLNSNLEAFYVRLVNIISNVDIGDAIVLRVFKNNPNYRFKGKMHEQVIQSIEKKGVSSIGSTDLKILHYGYDPDVSDLELKQKRNMELLNSYPESERDGYFYYSLGNEYARIYDNEKALEIYKKAIEFPIAPGATPVYMTYLCLNIAKTLYASKRHLDEINNLKVFEKKYPNFKDLYFMECLAQIECGQFSRAREALLKYTKCPDGNYEYPSSKFENQYNIDEFLEKLNQSSTDGSENLLSVLIIAYKDDPNLLNTVKSINEIANEVIIATPNDIDLTESNVKNIGAKVIKVQSDDSEEIFLKGYEECNFKFVLLMKSGEVCSLESQKNMVVFLENTNNNYFNLSVLNTKTNTKSNEFRLFRNIEKLKTYKDFIELGNYIHSNNIDNTNIYLHKI